MKKLFPAIFSVILFSILAGAQDKAFESYSRLLSPEKLYLQTDREVYCLGDTIWFKGYLQDVSEIAEYPECNYIYVELISGVYMKSPYNSKLEFSPRDVVVRRIKVKRVDDSFTGYIEVGEYCNTGIATLRAYSYWMMNGDPGYMFNKSLEIRNPMKDRYVQDLVEAEAQDDYLYSEIGVANPFRKPMFKPKPKDETKLDIQFLPESGRYLYGTRSVMGVKVLNSDGLGVKVSGMVRCDGKNIAMFETNGLGMGRFDITVPEGAKELTCELETEIENFLYDAKLPMPEERAVTINVLTDQQGVSLAVNDAGLDLPDSTFIVIHDRTEMFFKVPYNAANKRLRFGYDLLSEGINNAAVVDAEGNVYAQRCFFVYPKDKVSATISYDKTSYKKRERVRASVELKDAEGKPVSGDFSLAVTDDEWSPYSGENHNMVSYMLLGSELTGMVEKPQHYFSDSLDLAQRIADMDLLMMTQGWNYYDLPSILKGENKMPTFGKEFTQSLSGYVTGPFGAKSKSSTICFAAPSIDFFLVGDLDSCAFFSLNELDFPDSTQFLVGAQGQKKRFKDWYQPVLNPDYFAQMYKYPEYLKNAAYSDKYKDFATSSYYSGGGEITYMLMPSRIVAVPDGLSPFPNDNFPKRNVKGEKELKPYAESYTVMDYCVEVLHFKKRPGQGGGWELYGKNLNELSIDRIIPTGDQRVPTSVSVYLNGLPCREEFERQMVYEMPLNQVEALAYIDGLNAGKYVYDFILLASDKIVPALLIKSKMPSRAAYNVIADRPIGWQTPARRYEPKYLTSKSKEAFEPMRATLHWEPKLEVRDGKAEFEFWTSDSDAPYTVILEGISGDGKYTTSVNEFVR